jgi:uncharacterized protein (PEP-CTERM system associated)
MTPSRRFSLAGSVAAISAALLGAQPSLALAQFGGIPGGFGPGVGAPFTPGFGGPTPGAFGAGIGSTFPGTPGTFAASQGATGTPGNRIQPFVSILETLSSNYTLTQDPQSGLVSQVTPGVRVFAGGARARLFGSIAATWTTYIPNRGNYNTLAPAVNLFGNAELIQRFFYVDGAIGANRVFNNPLGPIGSSTAVAPQNQVTTASYRISPYVQGVLPGNISYLVRNDNIWSTLNNAQTTALSLSAPTGTSYVNRLFARVASPIDPGGWALEYDRNQVDFSEQSANFVTQVARARLFYNVNESLQVSASGGWEDNNYFSGEGGQYSGSIYGAGLNWRPSPRTTLFANWEHRFFGSSYLVNFQHRRPLSAFQLLLTRSITTFPQQLASIPAGASTAPLLDSIFASRIPDPNERAQFVDQLITSRGLPTTVSSQVTLYTPQILLFEQASAIFSLIGARNTASLNLFRYRQEPITATGVVLPPNVLALQNNTQIGGTVSLTHNLAPDLSLLGAVSYFDTEFEAPLSGSSNTFTLRAQLNNRLTAKTSGFAGARYQVFRTDYSGSVFATPSTRANEVAIFAGITHTF